MAMNDTFMQEYGLLQVSNARHRADLQLGSLNLIAPTWPRIFLARSLVSFPDPTLTEIGSASTSDYYHASGCGQYVHKRISFIKRILHYHLRL